MQSYIIAIDFNICSYCFDAETRDFISGLFAVRSSFACIRLSRSSRTFSCDELILRKML
jgi:hypothetical protein